MRELESFELEQVSGGGKAWGHLKPNNPNYDSERSLPPGAIPPGIAKKLPMDEGGEEST